MLDIKKIATGSNISYSATQIVALNTNQKIVRPQQPQIQTDGPPAVARLFRGTNTQSSKNSKFKSYQVLHSVLLNVQALSYIFWTLRLTIIFSWKKLNVSTLIFNNVELKVSQDYLYLIKIQQEKVKLFPK